MLTDAVSSAGTRKPDFAAISHVGHSRERNEDCCYVQPEGGLAIVADGVGGQGDGAWASRRAVDLIIQRVEALNGSEAGEAVILNILQQVHVQMFAETRRCPGKPSGTTIAGIWAPHGVDAPIIVFNVGDSAVFHFSRRGMIKLSQDHSLHQLWEDGGRNGREPSRRMIVQAMGISEQMTPHLASVRIIEGETVLLCTDGLSSTVSVDRMAVAMAEDKSSRSICDILLCDALAGRAMDNVTVSVCRF